MGQPVGRREAFTGHHSRITIEGSGSSILKHQVSASRTECLQHLVWAVSVHSRSPEIAYLRTKIL